MTEGSTPALDDFVDRLPSTGSFSVWCGPATGDPSFSHRADDPHYAASMMKLALVIAVYRDAEAGRLDLDRDVLVHDDFASRADGSTYTMDRADDSDAEPWRRLGEQVALRWLCYRAIVRSSNLATNLVLDVVGTDAVSMALQAAGASGSAVTRGIEDGAARDAGLQNIVTAADLARTLQSLHSGTILSRDGCDEIVSVLAAQQINDAIPVRLPPGSRVAHKSGWVEGVSHDAGIIFSTSGETEPLVFVMCTTSDLDEQAGLDLIAAGAAAAWEDWGGSPA